MERFHSVTLIEDRCRGCTNCIKRCPTEAIRVRNGKAKIISGRCIDCGECIRLCPHRAKQADCDTLDALKRYEYSIALPAPSLYGQFADVSSIDVILNALLELGFDDVFEVSRAAELVSAATRRYINSPAVKKPVISSACPTITRLIQIRFPSLIEYILPITTPAELAGCIAKKEAMTKTGLPEDKIAAFFITPCPAKATTITSPLGIEKSSLNAAIAVKEIYPQLLGAIKRVTKNGKTFKIKSGRLGVGWGTSGGEATAAFGGRYLAADGIENCIRVLEDLEDKKFSLDFVELNACPGGCVGGVLTIENPYIAMVKLKQLRDKLPISGSEYEEVAPEAIKYSKPLRYDPVMELDSDLKTALQKMRELDEIAAGLRGLDCGSCGAPTCRAFAEDIVQGKISRDGCIFVLRETMRNLARTLDELGK